MTTPTITPEQVASTSGLTLRGLQVSLGGKEIIPPLDLEIAKGEMLCLLGPSGCGKTTTLRMIGGFQQADAGQILIGDRDWAGKRPEQRPTAMVFQNYALWPHMSVQKNVEYPLTVRRTAKPERAERVEEALRLVGLFDKAKRRPARLSGGEQQRVALARALVQRPEILLLDEPLSNLDAKLRVQVRDEIRGIQQRLGITSVFVTHDQEEALAISDRIAVMHDGNLEQLADPVAVYHRPATEFVAGFIGDMRFVEATHGGTGADGRPLLRLAPGVELPVRTLSAPFEGEARIGIRPEQVRCTRSGEDAERSFTITRVTPRGRDALYAAEREGIEVLCAAPVSSFGVGDRVQVGVEEALVYQDGRLVEGAA